VMLDDRIVYDAAAHVNLRPRDRQCGYVFQNYALFPHMTLRENLAFAAERHPRLERHRKINEMLERFRLLEFAGRYPHEVSGGQKQRCSIARALVSAPRVLLHVGFEASSVVAAPSPRTRVGVVLTSSAAGPAAGRGDALWCGVGAGAWDELAAALPRLAAAHTNSGTR